MISNIAYSLAYIGLGLALLVAGYYVLDLLTPGHLANHIWKEGSVNAALVLAGGVTGLGAILFTSIWSNAAGDAGFATGVGWTVSFGLVGILAQAVSFVTLDLLTPGKLGEVVCRVSFHPASIVTVAVQLAVAGLVCASIA